VASTGGLVAPLLYVGDGEHAALEGGSVGGLLDMCELFLVGAGGGWKGGGGSNLRRLGGSVAWEKGLVVQVVMEMIGFPGYTVAYSPRVVALKLKAGLDLAVLNVRIMATFPWRLGVRLPR